MMNKRCALIIVLILMLSFSPTALAEGLEPLPMDSTAIAPPPKDECFLSDWEYEDASIAVKIWEGDYELSGPIFRLPVHYTCAHIKIAHPSQLRTVPAAQADDPRAVFTASGSSGAKCDRIAGAANAVVAINGDFYANADKCHVVMRQGLQVRNKADGSFDVLVIDKNGDFNLLPHCTKNDYIAYYDAHADSMYQAFCFGPLLVKDGKSVIEETFDNAYMIAQKQTQRVALCQVGDLEYLIITCDGDAISYTFGMTVYEFAQLCEKVGREISPDGLRMAYNLDGGNSASLVFKRRDENGSLKYEKLNMPERERDLADMVCFVSLVK